jgi:lysylphosphatidylglycerol synthetase-like protein (DUF2156 family)
MSDERPNHFLRFLTVFAITLIGTAPVALFLFAMSLVATENVIYPTASLATAGIAALVAGWAANSLGEIGERTDLQATVVRNLIWALLPAVASIFLATSLDRSIWLIATVLVYTSITAGLHAVRHRTTTTTTLTDGKLTVGWLVGTLVTFGVVIFIASLFGLTGA